MPSVLRYYAYRDHISMRWNSRQLSGCISAVADFARLDLSQVGSLRPVARRPASIA